MIAPDNWRKSSYSGSGDGNACVEVTIRDCRIAVRDSKDLSRTPIILPVPAFAALVEGLKERQGRPA